MLTKKQNKKSAHMWSTEVLVEKAMKQESRVFSKGQISMQKL